MPGNKLIVGLSLITFQVPFLLRDQVDLLDLVNLPGVKGLPRIKSPLQEAGPSQSHEERRGKMLNLNFTSRGPFSLNPVIT